MHSFYRGMITLIERKLRIRNSLEDVVCLVDTSAH